VRGRLSGLYRYPLKGFTPERLERVDLLAGAGLPHDRRYVVEDGPSGFDPDAPSHISKMRFAVLAKIPEVACIRTRYDERAGVLHAEAPNVAPIDAGLNQASGRQAFAGWLTEVLGDKANGTLRVLEAPGDHRFYDSWKGYASLINLASLRDLEARIGQRLDPLRFRANLYVEGWPAWAELETVGRGVRLGQVRARITRHIPRCVATHANPTTGIRDIDVLAVLGRDYGHVLCGIYLDIEQGGPIATGDPVELM
jgi:uncharacterized protein